MPMTKLYFRHDFHARNDPQLLDINMALGMEGIGIYWTLLEMFFENEGFVNEKELKLMCFEVHVDFSKAKKVLDMAGFVNNNGVYSKEGVIKRINKREETSKKMKDRANTRWNNNTSKKREAPVPDWMKEEESKNKLTKEEKEKMKKIFEE